VVLRIWFDDIYRDNDTETLNRNCPLPFNRQ